MGQDNSKQPPCGFPGKSDVVVLREGFMEKRGNIRKTKYKKRWFILQNNKTMAYFENPGDSKPKGQCNFAAVSKMEMTEPLTFEVTTAERVWSFRCETAKECEEWFGAIRQVVRYQSPREIADIVSNEIIPDLVAEDKKKYQVLSEKKHLIRSLLLKNDCDSFAVNLMDKRGFGDAIWKCSGEFALRYPAYSLFEALKKRVLEESTATKWKWIAQAVAHELTPKLSDSVKAVSSELGEVNRYIRRTKTYISGDKLVSAINNRKERKLTFFESRYLRALIERVWTGNEWAMSLKDKCYVFNLHNFAIHCVRTSVILND